MLQLMGSWVPIFKSCIDSEAAPFITFSFATVDSKGKPKVRTCIYRGFLFNNSKSNVLTFTTDKRMLKYQELNKNCDFEACFYFHKSKKQFRFSGISKVINKEVTPSIVLPKLHDPSGSISSDASDEFKEHIENNNKIADDDIVLLNINDRIGSDLDLNSSDEKLSDSLVYPLISPAFLKEYNSLEDDDAQIPELVPPTHEEWQAELDRQWQALSRTMKSSFRKPTPGSKITPEKRVLLDAISRRVDGNKDEAGLENFSVVCMFVDVVDLVDLDTANNRRFVISRVHDDHWREVEVCP